MRKDEYLNILSARLNVLPADEYTDIMEYYKEYFEEAGEENEEDVISELGDVEELAKKIIKENMGDEGVNSSMTSQTYTSNYEPYNNKEKLYNQKEQPYISQNGTYAQMNAPYNQNNQTYTQMNGQPYVPYQPQKSGLSTGWKIVIAILTSPIWLGLAAGACGIVFGFGVAAIACFFTSIATITAGLALIGTSGATCMLFVGGGFIVLAVAFAMLMVAVGVSYLIGKAFTAIFGKKEQPCYM